MKPTQRLHDLGQSLWLDNITRDLLSSGTLAGYIAELSVTGLTSNPSIFDHAIKSSSAYDDAIRDGAKAGRSTGTKDPEASDILYVKALASPYTVNTMPEKTLLAFADHGDVGAPLAIGGGGGDAEEVLASYARAGVDVDALAVQLQEEGAKAFAKSWNEMLARIAHKTAAAAGTS